MRIARRERSPDRVRELRSQIVGAICPAIVDGRVCGSHCMARCPQCGSTACHCRCSPQCAEAPRALSSEPDHYPIEPAILPLVFEMKRLGLFDPCWSCEGHLGPDGALWKLPTVWFYCDSTVHLRLLSDLLDDLELSGRLGVHWQVVVTFSNADNPCTTFSLEPVPPSASASLLPAMQKDVLVIARSLAATIADRAQKLLGAAEEALASER